MSTNHANSHALARWMVAALVGLAVVAWAPQASAQDASTTTQPADAVDVVPAPLTTLTDDGLSVSAESADGRRTVLTSTAASDLAAAGETVTVTGDGFDTAHGVYVAVCVIPGLDQAPTPCGGGVALEGSDGASHWISSNPPPYGADLVIPYGDGGTFEVQLAVHPKISEDLDCRKVQCAITSRNDHLSSSDRSQDLFIPIEFVGSSLSATSTTTPTTLASTAQGSEGELESAQQDGAQSASSAEDEPGEDGSNSAVVIITLVVIAAAGATFASTRRKKP